MSPSSAGRRAVRLGDPGSAPLRLRDERRHLSPGDRLVVEVPQASRHGWDGRTLLDVVEGAGFVMRAIPDTHRVETEMVTSLADTVSDGMRLLVVGLNPSPAAAASGVGFAHPSNRFWPAALLAGCAAVDRDPLDALVRHGMGMTDLVKRTTSRASELRLEEFRHGGERLERLVRRHRPGVVCVVGLTGWRAARDPRAVEGRQPEPFGGRPLHVIGNPSGLNAHQTAARCASQLLEALADGDAIDAPPPPLG